MHDTAMKIGQNDTAIKIGQNVSNRLIWKVKRFVTAAAR